MPLSKLVAITAQTEQAAQGTHGAELRLSSGCQRNSAIEAEARSQNVALISRCRTKNATDG